MKLRSSYICQQCSAQFPQWYGKCPSCDSWNSLVETVQEQPSSSSRKTFRTTTASTPQRLSDVKHIEKHRLKSGLGEFDRVMGGGIVPGSVTLLAGDPGIGKSTLLLHVLSAIGGMYVSGEESGEQIKLRAKRMNVDGSNIMVLAETVLEGITEALVKWAADGTNSTTKLVVIDSIQTLSSHELDGMAGSVGQIRYCAEELVTYAKSRGIPILIIGHVTKEGEIAGPKVLEHMVDTVLYLEGERYADARILRTLKNRFGPIEEVGIFEMKEKGLNEIANPSEIFLQDRVKNVSGSVVTVIMEGSRPLLVEIQALVVSSQLPIPRRVANGFDYNRLQLLTAILSKRLGLPLGTSDVFINVSGGLKLTEPAADLAVAMAIISSFTNKPVDAKTVIFGELGLLGEVRRVGQEERRIKESKRLGFARIVSPQGIKNLKLAAQLLQ